MARVYYNKLIRDGIPAKMDRSGADYETRTIKDNDEFEQELLKKVAEEARGLSMNTSRDEYLSELADLLEVIEALTEHFGLTEADVTKAREKNRAKKGQFKQRLFLHWSSKNEYKSNETPQGIKN